MIQCPVCRAQTSGPNCRRCRADLRLLETVEARRDYLLAVARQEIHENELDAALDRFIDAADLRTGPDIRQMRACTFLLAGDYESAMTEYMLAHRS